MARSATLPAIRALSLALAPALQALALMAMMAPQAPAAAFELLMHGSGVDKRAY